MMGLLEFAAKYLPDLEKAAEGGDINKKSLKRRRLRQALRQAKHRSRARPDRARGGVMSVGPQLVPAASMHPAGLGGTMLAKQTNPPTTPWVLPQAVPLSKLYGKPSPACFPPGICLPIQVPRKRAPTRQDQDRASSKLSQGSHKKGIVPKTGPLISGVSEALDTFKKKRDKFLSYLKQLQSELTDLNLPSPSKEEIKHKPKKKEKPKKKKKNIDKVSVSKAKKEDVGKTAGGVKRSVGGGGTLRKSKKRSKLVPAGGATRKDSMGTRLSHVVVGDGSVQSYPVMEWNRGDEKHRTAV